MRGAHLSRLVKPELNCAESGSDGKRCHGGHLWGKTAQCVDNLPDQMRVGRRKSIRRCGDLLRQACRIACTVLIAS